MTDRGPLPFVRACELADRAPEQRWLIERLWAASGVGVLGGAPKSCKSWLGLEMAVSVASGTPCLGTFAVPRQGRALIYMAEDSAPVVRERLDALCRHHRVRLDALDLFVIVSDTLRIDVCEQQQRLRETMQRLKPAMLLLDPLIRLHRANENDSGEVSAILAYLRALQREQDTAIVLVHHARKNGSGDQPGQSLRGSGDIHAFGDSNLYLRRKARQILLSIEHRAAPSPDPLLLDLVEGDTPHLAISTSTGTPAEDEEGRSVDEAILGLLELAQRPMTRTALRSQIRTRNERLGQVLADMETRGLVRRVTGGWVHESFRSAPKRSTGTGTERSPAPA